VLGQKFSLEYLQTMGQQQGQRFLFRLLQVAMEQQEELGHKLLAILMGIITVI